MRALCAHIVCGHLCARIVARMWVSRGRETSHAGRRETLFGNASRVDACGKYSRGPAGVHRPPIIRAHMCARFIALVWTPAGMRTRWP